MRYLCVILFFAGILNAEDVPPSPEKINVAGWAFSRERKTVDSSNRVVANLTLKNVTDAPINGVTATLTLATGLGEPVGEPFTQSLGALKPGEQRKETFSGNLIPAFGSYRVKVAFAGGVEEWFGDTETAQPQFRNPTLNGAANLVILGREVSVNASGQLAGTVRVRNEGTAEAKDTKLTAVFFDANKKKLGEWTVKLGSGVVAGNSEANIPFMLAKIPKAHASYTLNVACEPPPPEAALAGGEFTNVADVEFAQFNFVRDPEPATGLSVTAKVRNGLNVGVEHVKLDLIFYGAKRKVIKKYTYDCPGSLKPGEIKPVSFKIGAVPNYVEFENHIEYQRLGLGGTAPAPAAAADTGVKFKQTAEVEVAFGNAAEQGKDAILQGGVRNGLKTAIKNVTVTVNFLKEDGTVLATGTATVPETIEPDEERAFEVKGEGAASFSTYTFSFKHQK